MAFLPVPVASEMKEWHSAEETPGALCNTNTTPGIVDRRGWWWLGLPIAESYYCLERRRECRGGLTGHSDRSAGSLLKGEGARGGHCRGADRNPSKMRKSQSPHVHTGHTDGNAAAKVAG